MLNAEPRKGPREKEVSTSAGTSTRVSGPRHEATQEDWAARQRGTTEAQARDFTRAMERLRNTSPARAKALIKAQGPGMMEMYILAEMAGENREVVLRGLPKPSARAIERYATVSA